MKTVKRACIIFLLSFLLLSGEALAVSANAGYGRRLSGMMTDINAAVIFDVTENKLIFAKNEKQRISVASTTKLMTCLVALHYMSPDDVLTVGDEIDLRKPYSSVAGLSYKSGHTLKLRTLIAALLLPSGNDAAYTVAVNVARHHSGNKEMDNTQAVAYFCSLMNEYAQKLGCKNTSFVNPEGWDDVNHYSTAEDMTLIALEAMKNVFITSTAAIQNRNFTFHSGHWINWENTNLLLDKESKYYCKYATGLKTGTTNAAGKCLVASAEKDGKQLLILVYGAKTEDDRFGKVKEAVEFLFDAPFMGDVDIDGVISAADARIVLRASVGLETVSTDILERGDIDGDEKLSAADARVILRASVGLQSIQNISE